jgi:PTS system nitrogen regulatory IIA component
MDLKLKEVAELLQVSEKTIYRWVKDGKIPCYRINHQYRFHSDEIEQWVDSGKNIKNCSFQKKNIVKVSIKEEASLYKSLKRGGIYYRISSSDINSALSDSVDLMNIPKGLNRGDVLDLLIKRESMAPTSVGNGIAFPHPREQIVPDIADECFSICFLETPIADYALDSIPLHTLIIILSATAETHLKTLSRLSYLCRDKIFIEMLETHASREELFEFIKKAEKEKFPDC